MNDPDRCARVARLLLMLSLLLFPLLFLALLDISQGGESVVLEWWVVRVSLLVIVVSMATALRALWRTADR